MELYNDPRRSGVFNEKPVLGLRRVEVERHYDQNEHFFERSKQETISILTIRSRTHLLAFLVVLCQFAVIDTINLLPAGLILYSVGIAMAVEVWQTGSADDLFFFGDPLKEEMEAMQKEEENLRLAIEKAKFEYHVLRRNPRARIVPIRKDGTTVLYAI
jgi:hypothetical protein